MIYLLSILTAIQVWDAHTTSDAKKCGYGYESNKILAILNRLSEDQAFWLLLGLKAALCAGLWYEFLPLQGWEPMAILCALIAFYTYFVVISNTRLWYNFHWAKK